jgi:spore maturation protein SpmA
MFRVGVFWTYLVLVAFVLAFLIGVNSGEVEAVFEKATTICLGCIGIE